MRVSTGGEVSARVVEQGGVPIHTVLDKPVHQDDDTCSKGDCIPCRSGQTKHQSCHRGAIGGVGYEQQCLLCLEEQKVAIYHGETSRTLYTRSKEHCTGQKKKKDDNPMHKQQANFHPGQEVQFSIKAIRFFNDPLTRQINEGVRINHSKSTPGYLMNSKSEFHQGVVARVTISRGLDS